MAYKRQVDVKVNVNLNETETFVRLVTNVTYAHTDVTSQQNAICPTAAFGK